MAALIVIIVLLPWKWLVAERLKSMLATQGLHDVQLTVAHIGIASVVLENIRIPGDPPTTLEHVMLDYSPLDLFAGKARGLALTGFSLEARSEGGRWTVAGFQKQPGPLKAPQSSLPVTAEELRSIPLDDLTLTKSHMHVVTAQAQIDVPLELRWRKLPLPTLTYAGTGLAFKAGGLSLNAGAGTLDLSLKPQEKRWEGNWQIKDIRLAGLPMPIPPLNGTGEIVAEADQLKIKGELLGAEGTYKFLFHLRHFLNEPAKDDLVIDSIALPWKSGMVHAEGITWPFEGHKLVSGTIEMQHIAAAELLRSFTGNKATATGSLSGALPMTFGADGKITLHEGRMTNEGPGVIALAPEAIPGENDNIVLLREVLQDFHYTVLTFDMNSQEGNSLKVRMDLEGGNPAVYAGRPVKVGVTLGGDVLGLIEENLSILNDPKKFLEQKPQ
ncbi:MAG: YdbH domain-containing protein [Pseudomonadota bacterium]|nr:YdbH domain-containing protein [Pseudomonadota bacterium]